MRECIACLVVALALSSCVEQRLTVNSAPEGALVYLNDAEIGRTPVTRDFVWYADQDVQLRKEGYETLKAHRSIVAPWWQWPPIDLFSELLPLRDHQGISFRLKPASTQPADSAMMLLRAAEMRAQLQSSEFTRKPTTQPTTRPAR